MNKIHINTKTNVKIASFFLIGILLAIGPMQFAHAFSLFGAPQSNSILPGGFNNVAVQANGSHVYVAYTDVSFNIGVSSSSDNGTTFSSTTFCGGTCSANQDEQPSLAVSDQYLYVAWLDGDRNIAFARSDDFGTSFAGVAPLEIGAGSSGVPASPHILAYGKNVYVQWIDDNGKIAFDASHDFGATWDSVTVLSTTNQIFDPQMATAGSNVYVVWEDKSVDASGDVNSTVLSTNGTVLGTSNNLSNTPGQSSSLPHIAAFKSSVYVVWQEQFSPTHKDVFFASSANNGTSFGAGTNLSNSGGIADNPQIAANASKVYTTWQDSTSANKNEILFKSSQNNGTTFGSATNISNNSGDSLFPKVALYANNVYVVWQDKTISNTGDILFKTSSDNGATFEGLKKLNNNANTINDNTEQISASKENVSVDWSDAANNVFYASAIQTTKEIKFSASQYSLNATATITITDPGANTNSGTQQTILADVVSTTDATGIVGLSLTETGINTGVFSGTITFSSVATSGTTLQATPGDVITATYSGQSSIASILPVTIIFDSPSGYDRGSIAHIVVNDPDANVDTTLAEKITVHVTSNANPSGIDLQLTETGVNTGIFGSVGSDNLIFMDSNNLFPSSGKTTITQTNTGANTDPSTIQTIVEQVNSTSDLPGITMNLNETGINTGVFSGVLTLNSSSVNHVAIKVVPGDFLRITRGFATENALITPNANTANGAILVTADPAVDSVKASYRGVTQSVLVSKLFDSGGSGGGLVRPGLVLNVIASISGGSNSVAPVFDLTTLTQTPGYLPDNIKNQLLSRDPSKPLEPAYDNSFDYPLVIDGGGYLLSYSNTLKTITEKTGAPVDFKLNIPVTNLVHLALYMNIKGDDPSLTQSDTYIIYDKGQKLQIVDPHHFLDGVKFDLDVQGIKNKIDYKITFANPMPKSDIVLRAWNDRMASADVKLINAWQVEEGPKSVSQNEVSSPQVFQVPPENSPQVSQPPTTTGSDVLSAIKDWGGYSPHPISDSELLSNVGVPGSSVPQWVMKTTKFVVEGDITTQDFENIVKYLSSEGLVK